MPAGQSEGGAGWGQAEAVVMPGEVRVSATVAWVIAGLLGLIAVELGMWSSGGARLEPMAVAQYEPVGAARGIFAFAGPVSPTTYGVFMVDVDAGTLWCYEIVPRGAKDRGLRLIAARSWLYDRYLENFNVSGLTPEQVADLVEQARAARNAALDTEGGPAEHAGGP